MIIHFLKRIFSKQNRVEKVANPFPKKNQHDKSIRKGELGEYKIDIQLAQLPKPFRFLNDLMIENPKSKTGYSQIDHVVISPYGLFVIETKNYAGEIKGKKEDKYWTVNNRFKMYSPLFQNYGHIKAIERILQNKTNFYSIISFTMRSRFNVDPELRKISSNELVVYDVEVSDYIHRKISRLASEKIAPILDQSQIEEIYSTLRDKDITDKSIRAEHSKNIQVRKSN